MTKSPQSSESNPSNYAQESPLRTRHWLMRFALVLPLLILLMGGSIINHPASANNSDEWEIHPGPEGTGCVYGDPFQFYTREGADPEKLMIYFQAGGACWTAALCNQFSIAHDKTVTDKELDTYGGIFNFAHPDNPVVDYNMVVIPACSGDVHIGNATIDYEGPFGGVLTIAHQGYTNATKVLEWVYEQYDSPDHILVAGSSAGAVGAIFFAPYIMEQYQDSAIVQFGDGYLGVIPDGWEPVNDWRVFDLPLPESVPGWQNLDPETFRFADLYKSVAEAYPQHRFGQYSHAYDVFQLSYLLFAGGDTRTYPDQRDAMLEELAQLPNYNFYIGTGFLHTILPFDEFYTMEEEGVIFRDWFAGLLNGEDVGNIHCERGRLGCP